MTGDSLNQLIGLAQRAREKREQYSREQAAADPLWSLSASGMNRSRADANAEFTGWGAFFQGLDESAERLGGPGVRHKVRLAGLKAAKP